MEPRLPAPERGPEMPAVNYGQSVERAPAFLNPETVAERRAEQLERKSEAATAAMSAAPVLPPVVLPAVPAPVAPATHVVDDDLPALANDDDLIEKEWVDKAKKIIAQTKDDPYRREEEVGRLQADYLRKRYGREIGASQ